MPPKGESALFYFRGGFDTYPGPGYPCFVRGRVDLEREAGDFKPGEKMNAHGLALRIVEEAVGPRDYSLFREFPAGGGIMGLLHDSLLKVNVVHRSVFRHNCREVVVLSGQENIR